MKTKTHLRFLPLGLAVAATLPAFAIDPPVDDAPPPPSVKTAASAPAATDSPERKADASARVAENSGAFIGLVTADVPDFLAVHIGIEKGGGVMIREIAPGSPADKAGLAKYDVITRLSGSPVSSAAELSRLIGNQKPGDEISIDFIHRGEPSVKNIKLEARPARTVGMLPLDRDPGAMDLQNLSDEQADRIRDLIERRLQNMRGRQEQLEQNFDTPAPRGGGLNGFQFKSDATFRLMDETGSIEMKSSDGSKEITVRDRENNVTWSGPWDTEQDKAAAPEEIRKRVEKFKLDDNFRGGGFRFRMGGGDPLDGR